MEAWVHQHLAVWIEETATAAPAKASEINAKLRGTWPAIKKQSHVRKDNAACFFELVGLTDRNATGTGYARYQWGSGPKITVIRRGDEIMTFLVREV